MTPWWIALQFLTRVPVHLSGMPSPEQIGRSLLFYPLVGLLIGVGLFIAQYFLATTPLLLQAALLLTLWVGISGGLHLDGLADSADAWVGGLGDKQRTLDIMKDPRCGPMAVLVLVLVLLLKFAALVALLEQQASALLILIPWLARWTVPLLLLTTPYVRPGGLGQTLAEHVPRAQLPWVLAAHALAMLVLGWAGVWALLVAGLGFVYLRRVMMQRLGGTTGDTAGALLELMECGLLLVLVCVL